MELENVMLFSFSIYLNVYQTLHILIMYGLFQLLYSRRKFTTNSNNKSLPTLKHMSKLTTSH